MSAKAQRRCTPPSGVRFAARLLLVALLATLVLPLYAVGEALLTHPSNDLQGLWLALVVVMLLGVAAIVCTSRHLRAQPGDAVDANAPAAPAMPAELDPVEIVPAVAPLATNEGLTRA